MVNEEGKLNSDTSIVTILTYQKDQDVEEFKIYNEEYIFEIVSEKILEARKENHITRAELAAMVGETEERIQYLEKNIREIDIETLNKILNALNLKMNISIEFKK